MTPEKQFENKVKRFLKEQGCWFVKYWGGSIYTKSGIPDLLICCNGFFISVELKASTGRPSELQKLNIRRINESNGIGIILYPEGFTEFKSLMKGVLKCNCHIPELNALKTAHTSTKCDILTE